jgi:hypothetical protein
MPPDTQLALEVRSQRPSRSLDTRRAFVKGSSLSEREVRHARRNQLRDESAIIGSGELGRSPEVLEGYVIFGPLPGHARRLVANRVDAREEFVVHTRSDLSNTLPALKERRAADGS